MGDIIKRQTGEVALTTELFSEDQKIIFDKVAGIADKNPVFDWSQPEHNLDFCLVEGTIEAVKNFYLKTQYISGLSIANISQQIIGTGEDQAAICTVKIWKEGEKRNVIMSGAATFKECGGVGYTNQKSGKKVYPNKRAFHDMVARAQTRAFKAGMEAYMGFPFINLMIEAIFGNFNVKGKPEDEGAGAKDVTGDYTEQETEKRNTLDPKTRLLSGNIWKTMEAARKKNILSADEINTNWDRVKQFYGKPDELLKEQARILKIISTRENVHNAGR